MQNKLLSIKKTDKRNIVMLILLGIMLALTFTLFMPAFARIHLSFKMFCENIVNLVLRITDFDTELSSSINDYQRIIDLYPNLFPPKLPNDIPMFPGTGGSTGGVDVFLPSSWELFIVKFNMYGRLWSSSDSWIFYAQGLVKIIFYIALGVIIYLPLHFLIKYIVRKNKIKTNANKHYKISKSLIFVKSILDKFVTPVINTIKYNAEYLVCTKWKSILIMLFLFNINVFAIITEAVATILYVLSTFDFTALYIGLYKFCIDSMPFIAYVPKTPIIIYILYKLYTKRFDKASKLRDRIDNTINKQFVSKLPATVQICGYPGAGKDRLMIDFDKTHEDIDKRKAKDKMYELNQMFNEFDWRNFGLFIKSKIDDRAFATLADIDVYFINVKKDFENEIKDIPYVPICDYNLDNYIGPMRYCNGIRYITIIDAMQFYAQSYYVLYAPTLLFSNISIRLDSYLMDIGNMIDFNTDYFAITPDVSEEVSHYCNELMQDSLRLYKKQNCNRPIDFELGRIHWSEMGKDYPNILDSKKDSNEEFDTTTDGLFDRLKMVRNGGTIDNDLYNGITANEQRDMNVNINYRDIASQIKILSVDERRSCVKLFKWERKLFAKLDVKYKEYKQSFDFRRGDTTLPYYLANKIMSRLFKYYNAIDNIYDYIEYTLDMDGKEYTYYVFTKKVYNGCYMTDVFNEPIKERVLKSGYGLFNAKKFSAERATVAECKEMGSRMFNKIYSIKVENTSNDKLLKKQIANLIKEETKKNN